MKLEKRGSVEAENPPQEETAPESSGGKKPVIIYIMILFIAAFLLMAFSFLMHQRSNTEVIGKLQDQVSALQEVQIMQEKNLQLQDELDALETQIDGLNQQISAAETARADAQDQSDALLKLYTLQQQYANGDYDACKQTIQDMEDSGKSKLLPTSSGTDGVTSPADRYQQLKEAAMSK